MSKVKAQSALRSPKYNLKLKIPTTVEYVVVIEASLTVNSAEFLNLRVSVCRM